MKTLKTLPVKQWILASCFVLIGVIPGVYCWANNGAEGVLVSPTPSPEVTSTVAPMHHKVPKVAIIIDDIGLLRKPADELLQLPIHLNWSVFPFGEFSSEYAKKGQEKGFEIMLHLPLETIKGKVKVGPGVIEPNWSEEQMLKQLDLDLAQVPQAIGINNHMGTTGPNDTRLTDLLMREVKRRGLFYVDSITDRSIAAQYARKYDVLFAKRDVFIDHYKTIKDNEESIRQLINLAVKHGEAIGIGHPRPGTAQMIRDMLPEFAKAGVEIVPISELVHVPPPIPSPTATPAPIHSQHTLATIKPHVS